MRQVDAAGSKVDEGHGDALPLQGGELVEVHRAELDVVDEVVRIGAAEAEGKVILVEQSNLLLQGGEKWCRRTVSVCSVYPRTDKHGAQDAGEGVQSCGPTTVRRNVCDLYRCISI